MGADIGAVLGSIGGMLAFGATVVGLGLLTGLIMMFIIRELQERYHIFI